MTDERELSTGTGLGWRIQLLLVCYPPWWRVRYDDEMRDTVLAMREAGHWRKSSGLDLLRGLMSAWLNPATIPCDQGMPERDRRLVPFAAWGLLLFALGGAGFAKMLDYPPFTTAADRHPALGWCVTALVGAAVCTAVVMSTAALVALAGLMRQPGCRRQTARPLLVVPLSAAALAATVGIARRVADGPAHAHQGFAFVALVAVTGVCGLVCTIALMRTAVRVPESRAVAVSRTVALVLVGALTTLATLSVLAWTLVAAGETPTLLQGHAGLVSTPTALTLAITLAGLVAAAALCLRATAGVMAQQPSRRSAK